MLSNLRSQIRTRRYFRHFLSPQKFLEAGAGFLVDYYFGKGKSQFPINFDMIITSKCNLNCSFCNYRPALHSKDMELTAKEWIEFIDSVSATRPSFFFTGGEPFLRKDIFEIFRHLHEKKLSYGVITNGTLLTKEKLDQLSNLNAENIFFSLHGKEDTHDRLVGQSGAFRRLVSSIRYLSAKKTHPVIIINSVADEGNIDDVESLIDICGQAGADYFRLQHRAFLLPDELKSQNDLFKKDFPGLKNMVINDVVARPPNIGKKLIVLQQKRFSMPVVFQPYLSKRETLSRYSSSPTLNRMCPIVWLTSTVQPNGDVVPCCYHGLKLGNVIEKSFVDIWNSSEYKKFRQILKAGLYPACKRCTRI